MAEPDVHQVDIPVMVRLNVSYQDDRIVGVTASLTPAEAEHATARERELEKLSHELRAGRISLASLGVVVEPPDVDAIHAPHPLSPDQVRELGALAHVSAAPPREPTCRRCGRPDYAWDSSRPTPYA